MSGQHDLTAAVEAAWAGFRVRLADRLAGFEDDDTLLVEVQVAADDDELEGASPYLGLIGGDAGVIRAATPGNQLLDPRFHLDEKDEAVLPRRRVAAPGDGEEHFVQDAETRDADRVAVCCVRVLREVYAVPHPVFLSAEGLERAPAVPGPAAPEHRDDAEDDLQEDDLREDEVTLPATHDELQALVDAAVAELAEVQHDDDGDIALRAGLSVLFVRVLADRPAVEIFAELVHDPGRPERIPVELDILNRSHELARFHSTPGGVTMSYVLVAWPFAPRQLRVLLRTLLGQVDALAEQLALRLEGRRYLQEPEPEHEPQIQPRPTRPGPAVAPTATGVMQTHPGMAGLLELLHLGPVSSPAVAQLFEHDRRALIVHLVGVRTGTVDLVGHDEDRVLTCLRRGLRYVVDREIPERRARRLPSRARTEQPSLIADDDLGEGTLDLGRSA